MATQPNVKRTGKGAVRLDEKLGASLVRGGVADALRSKVLALSVCAGAVTGSKE